MKALTWHNARAVLLRVGYPAMLGLGLVCLTWGFWHDGLAQLGDFLQAIFFIGMGATWGMLADKRRDPAVLFWACMTWPLGLAIVYYQGWRDRLPKASGEILSRLGEYWGVARHPPIAKRTWRRLWLWPTMVGEGDEEYRARILAECRRKYPRDCTHLC